MATPKRFIRVWIASFLATSTIAGNESKLENFLSSFDMDARIIDMSCSSSLSSDDCGSHKAASTGGGCTWCDSNEICLNGHQKEVMGNLGLSCDKNEDNLWVSSRQCFSASTSQEDCLQSGGEDGGEPSCAWCVLEDPKVGVCMSHEVNLKLKDAGLAQAAKSGTAGALLSDVMKCYGTASSQHEEESVTGVNDMSCLRLNTRGREECGKGTDSASNPCVFIEHFLESDSDHQTIDVGLLCLSQAQEKVLNSIISSMKHASLKWFVSSTTTDGQIVGN